MEYIHRHLETALKRTEKMFAALLVTGSRQTGKTRLLRELYSSLRYITLDNPVQYNEAMTDPDGFFKKYPPPAVLDEIQYAPALFTQIKLIADGIVTNGVHAVTASEISGAHKGLFFMSGSQQYSLMKGVSESLAGRIGIFTLYGLSRREITGINFNEPFLPVEDYFKKRAPLVGRQAYTEVWKNIHRGSYPEMQDEGIDWEAFYSAYVRTYIERDVRQLVNIGDEHAFYQFLIAMAARNGRILNYSSIANDIGLSMPTVKRWTSILLASNIIYLLQPFRNSSLKRSLGTPKLYFLDTGLAAYLSGWNTPEVLERGAEAGHLFESYCIAEILKSYSNAGKEPFLYYYRDKEQHEIDLMIFQNATLYPLEIKKHSSPRPSDIRAFSCLDKIPGIKRGPGGVICLYDQLSLLGKTDRVIPLDYI
jgi:predicted AAA+ superfamily ATPase